jgi:formate/nitrite transporter FocA (FNT family)
LNLSQEFVVVIGSTLASVFHWKMTMVNRIGTWIGTWIGAVCLVSILSGASLAASPDWNTSAPVDRQGQVQNPPTDRLYQSLLCDSLGAQSCFRALAHQLQQQTVPTAAPFSAR